MLTDADKQAVRDYCRAHADGYRSGGVLDVAMLAYNAARGAEIGCDAYTAERYALDVCEGLAEESGAETAMTHEDKTTWMHEWCDTHGFKLELAGEVGFGRECVGIVRDGQFPTFWDCEREDYDNKPWKPVDAYHKHDCVAVLGRGEHAESQLYDWLKWFDANGYVAEDKRSSGNSAAAVFFGQRTTPWLVKGK